jgi:hypothetical protein
VQLNVIGWQHNSSNDESHYNAIYFHLQKLAANGATTAESSIGKEVNYCRNRDSRSGGYEE